MEFEVSAEFHIDEVMTAAGAQVQRGLEMYVLAAEGYAKLLCPVDNCTLRNSITQFENLVNSDRCKTIIVRKIQY